MLLVSRKNLFSCRKRKDFLLVLLKSSIKLENEKRLLIGAALVPNKPIYRNVNGNEFYISFDETTIEKLA